MTDTEYLDRAEALLGAIEAQCDAIGEGAGIDIDCQRAGGMLTLVFAADGQRQLVINQQKPLHEIWLAARAGGYHYRFSEGLWRDTRTGEDLFARLSSSASDLAGQALVFTPPAAAASQA
ncbi:MAG: iron donor protein CyaY [Burkholderiaceae bacterium]|jgi:CyaY protein|nr:iron donor protein CyaY [Burkholderiaceae bacterium]